MNIPKLSSLNCRTISEKYNIEHYPEFVEFLNAKYIKFSIGFTEKMYLYFHKLETPKLCPVCGKRLRFLTFFKGYQSYCSSQCVNKDPVNIKKIKQTKLERYGDENWNNSKKNKQTCLKKYGVENPFQAEIYKDKAKQTKLERHGDEHFTNREKFKQTNLERFGTSTYTKTEEYKNKQYKTKKKNHSFNSSKIETETKNWLDEIGIEYKYQYKSKEYPFVCDFWFPKQDLYLEIQGTWTHGNHPFNPNSEEDINILNLWKSKETRYYNNAVGVWSISDVKKRQWAHDHNLNWIELFHPTLSDIQKVLSNLII